MFGNRKPKPEDDESLVPHGLVWHATAEPTPEEKIKSEESLGHTIQYAQVVERARHQPVDPEPEPATERVSPSPQSAPIPWWRVPQPEAEPDRRISKPALLPLSEYVSTRPIEPETPRVPIRPMQIRPAQVQPIQVQPVEIQPSRIDTTEFASSQLTEARSAEIVQIPAPLLQAPRIQGSLAQAPEISKPQLYNSQADKPELFEISPAVSKTNRIAEILVSSISRVQSSGKVLWLSTVSFGGKVGERCLQTWESLELREGIVRAGTRVKNLIQAGATRSSRYAQTKSSAFIAVTRTGVAAGVARLQKLSARVSSASKPEIVRYSNTQPSPPSRVRLLIAASALQIKIVAAQRFSEWKMKRDGVAVDSRFWTSMTLSAIAAIAALAIVSLVPHYAAKSLPSQIVNTNPSVSANVAAPAAAPLPHADKTAARKTKSAKPVQTKTASTAAATPAKPRRQSNDDYVAPDTYKYYGTGTKSSR